MFDQCLAPEIRDRFGRLDARILTLHTVGISESGLNDRLKELFEVFRKDPLCEMAFLAGEARVDIRFTIRADNAQAVERIDWHG